MRDFRGTARIKLAVVGLIICALLVPVFLAIKPSVLWVLLGLAVVGLLAVLRGITETRKR